MQLLRFTMLALAIAVLVSPPAIGQITSQSGAIAGRVDDPSGAAVPNAKLVLSSDRGAQQSQTTGDSGQFTFPLLAPGTYRLTVEAKGFNKASLNDIRVQVTEVTTVPVQLEVGAETVEVSVVAEVTQVNVTNATLGNVLPGSTLEDLPLSTRNFTNLLAFNAGTAAAVPNASQIGRASTNVFVNGQRTTMNNLVINGIDSNNLGSNNFASVAIPAPDTIEEFRVQTSMYDASQGKTSGGNVNVITRGGGAQYHGQIYEFFRNEKLNANDFFFNKTGTARPILRQNQFGGNFGGPVPKLANTYFFGSYQGTRQVNGQSGAISQQMPVIPESRTRDAIASAFGLTPSQIDPVALALLNQKGQFGGWVVPTGVGAAPGQFGIATFSAPARFDDDQFNANADHNFGDRHRLSLRYFQANGQTLDPFGGGVTYGNGQTSPVRNNLASVSLTSTLTPAMINEARLGFNRVGSGAVPVEPVSLAAIGMSRFNSALFPNIPGFFTGETGSFGGINTNNDQSAFNNTIHFADTLAYTRGKHSFRIGFEMRQYQINQTNNFASRGATQFQTFKDFLQGNQLVAFIGTGQTARDFRAQDYSWYFQDDYKLTRRLTLNLGIRYDYLGPTTDKRNRIGNFDPNLLDAATLAKGGAGLLNGYILPEAADFGTVKGTPGVSRSTFTEGNKTNFSPRVGLAWDVFGTGKTSIRAGYGIYYVRIANQTLLQLLTAAPFFQLSNVTLPGTPLSNPFPNLPLPSAFPIFPATPELLGYSATGAPAFSAPLLTINPLQRNMRTPYAQHYNFTIQQQLPWKFSMEFGYIGSQGVRLLQSLNTNQALLANAASPVRGLTTVSFRDANARVSVIGFAPAGLNGVTDNGHSGYNAFVTTLNRRVGDLFLQGSYTFSKSIDNNSGNVAGAQDLGNSGGNQLVPTLLRGLSDFDRTHRLQVTYNYDLPAVGQGFWRRATSGWMIGGTAIFQSALPIAWACSACATANVYGITTGLFPDVVGDFKNIRKDGDPREYVDAGTSVFNAGILAPPVVMTQGQTFTNVNRLGGPGTDVYRIGGVAGTGHAGQLYGTLPRNPNIRGPFQQQWDFQVGKSFAIGEKVKLNFRSEFFNLFNYAFFTNPNSTVGSPAFGRYTTQSNAPRIIQFALKLAF